MKNLFYISMLILIFSCGGETKTDNNSAKTTSQPTVTEQNQSNSTTENISTSTEAETKNLAKGENSQELTAEKATSKTPVKNTSTKSTNTPKSTLEKTSTTTSVKNKVELETQKEMENAKALAEKIRLEEETVNIKNAAEEKAKAEFKAQQEAKAAAAEKEKKDQQVGDVVDSNNPKPTAEVGLHDNFDALLKKHVSSSGVVNYQGFKKDEVKLDTYLDALKKTNLEKSWSQNKELAFWINAYNAYTIKLILKNYPVKSIMDLHNGKPWDVKWIKIDQRTLSLNNIENDIIRPKFNEPRIHFAVNCAAKSCPPLLNKAWTESNLNANLERQTKSFINNSNYNTITSDNVEVSKIFDWYGKDFGDLRAYLNKYSNTTIPAGTSINFKSYNWDLNN